MNMLDNEEKQCNRTMSIGDDDSLIRCQLPMGHKGPHQESYESAYNGKVTTAFEKGATPVQIERVKHMIPDGDICWFKDGRKCPFLAIRDRFVGESIKFACYLSGEWSHFFSPSEYGKGCE